LCRLPHKIILRLTILCKSRIFFSFYNMTLSIYIAMLDQAFQRRRGMSLERVFNKNVYTDIQATNLGKKSFKI